MGKGKASQDFWSVEAGMPEGSIGGSDRLGYAVTTGHFDDDCYADLAVGMPSGSGVLVLYGSTNGLTTDRSTYFGRDSVQPGLTYNSAFGNGLAVGDFNGDGLDDIAAGAVEAQDSEHDPAGAVGVLYGSTTGITKTGAAWFTQDSPGVPGAAENFDAFGLTLAAGDFDGDGRTDLAVAAPSEELSGHPYAGGLVVLRGSKTGLTGTGAQWFDQDTAGVPGAVEARDDFGTAMTAGDVTGDGRADLVVGAPGEGIGAEFSAGAVTVLKGSKTGLTGTGAIGYDQNTAGIPGTAEHQDVFGSALAIGDFNRDGHPDLAIGAPDESAGSIESSGSVTVVYGTTKGLSATGSRYVDQNSAGVPGANEEHDNFGATLKTVHGAYAGKDALVVTSLRESINYTREGAFTVLPSGSSGLPGPTGYFFDEKNFPQHVGDYPDGFPDAEFGFALG
jgi:hypothetical protein